MKTLIVLSMGVFATAGVSAQEPSRAYERPMTKEESRFRALDHDNDRKLSEKEFRVAANAASEFSVLDADRDGFLSMSEFVSRPLPPAKTASPNEQ